MEKKIKHILQCFDVISVSKFCKIYGWEQSYLSRKLRGKSAMIGARFYPLADEEVDLLLRQLEQMGKKFAYKE